MPGGVVYLVGAGPGDPDLITVKGLSCIERADVLVYDRLVSPVLIARSRPDALKVNVGKEPGRHGQKQADINHLLYTHAEAGKVVCRLKGGDPFVFGRGGEEAGYLAERHIPYEVIPGVTSGVAVPAYAGIPVTHRDFASAVTLATGHEAPDKHGATVDWSRYSESNQTLVVYMGVEALPEIAAKLTAFGRAPGTPVAVISRGTTAEQRTVTGTLQDITDKVRSTGVASPALIVVGGVVSLRTQLAWTEHMPLHSQRWLIPTTGQPGEATGENLQLLGAEVWRWPVAVNCPPSRTPQPRIDIAALLVSSMESGCINHVLLPSPAATAHLVAVLGGTALLREVPLWCANEQTAQAARELGLHVNMAETAAVAV